MIVEQLNARLKAVAAVTDIVGSRIYPSHLPQQVTFPALSHMQVSGEPVHAMGSDPDVRSMRFAVHCWSQQYSEAKTLAGAVRGALSRHRATAGGDEFLDVFTANEVDDYDPQTRVHQVIVDFDVWYREA